VVHGRGGGHHDRGLAVIKRVVQGQVVHRVGRVQIRLILVACRAALGGRSLLDSVLGLESFPGDDLDAQVDALVADVDPRTGD
jgi:hypothetical protein